MSQSDPAKNFDRSVRILNEILEGLETLQEISPCTKSNCPNYEEIEKLGDCPPSCKFKTVKVKKDKLYTWLCGGSVRGWRSQNSA